MDVDLLRPGTVPISPETVLWFEFLLNPSLLQNHLSKPSPDPSPTDLIIKFISINAEQNEIKIIENDVGDVKVNTSSKWTYKNLALKILSLKVAAHLEWDLELLQKKIPLPMQITLLQDLFYIVMGEVVEIPDIPEIYLEFIKDQMLFLAVLYHRWLLNTIVNRALNNKHPAIQESTFASMMMNEEIVRKLESQASESVEFLKSVLSELKNIEPKVLSFDTFQMLTENSTEVKQDWDNVYSITEDEFKCQIHYDLAVFHMFREEYKEAKQNLTQAKNLFVKLNSTKPMLYCKINRERLYGFCLACELAVDGHEPDLVQRLLKSMKEQYQDIIIILQEDNIVKKIPQVYRDNLELDIQGGLAHRKISIDRDLLLQIQCLNLVRRVLDNEPIIGDYTANIKVAGEKGVEILFWAFNGVMDKLSLTSKQRIAQYLLYLMVMGEIEGLAKRILNDSTYANLFSESELKEIKNEAESELFDIPNLLLNDDWGIEPVDYIQKHRVELFELEQRLILSYNPNEIKSILMELLKLDKSNKYNKQLWTINNSWEVPIPLQSVMSHIPPSFFKDYAYILLAKSKELALSQDFAGAKILLHAIEDELHQQNNHFKLVKLLQWELLLVEICHCLHVWPANDICEPEVITEKCQKCLASLQSSDQILPRQEIVEYCTVFLLNMAQWDFLTSLEKQWSCFEFAAALSNVAKKTYNNGLKEKNKDLKFPKEAWEMVLAVCKPNRDFPQKRSASGAVGSSVSRDFLTSISSTFSRLRETTVLNIAISLLARLYNILRENDSNFELHAAYLNSWPASVPNAKLYNTRIVGEYLFQLLTQALEYYPNNIAWLRLMGDLNFVLGFYESAMKYYLEAIIVASDFFTSPPGKIIDDFVYRRMIKCCAHLQCYTQAVVLCQFLDEVDYTLAFKMAGNEQKNTAPNDAMDAYYHCIWDTTILEYLINLHTKRGEHHRKQLAIKNIGLLELNSNNNDEIQREAANVRKAKFLRALAKQYVY